MLHVCYQVETLNPSVPPCIALSLPRPGLRPVPSDELSVAQKVLVWSGPYQGPASRSFSTGPALELELEQVGPRSKGEGRGKTRAQLQRGELVGR